MTRSADDIAADLEALSTDDFDWNNSDSRGWERLAAACDDVRALRETQVVARMLLGLAERLPDSDLGSPGPIVHTLEARADYQPWLADSVARRPVPLTIWMVNRILNTNPPDSEKWLRLLRQAAAADSGATPRTRDEAQHFLDLEARQRALHDRS